tara:strand:- start:9463 stop:9747 length:285 start_codon:yes stop_codon:yes gene_type:complete
MKNDFDNLTSEAIDNIRADREQTTQLLQDLIHYLAGADERHKEVGITAAKYVETLQRSNEQLVKIAALKKKDDLDDTSLSEDERAEIFEELNKK